MAFRDHSVGLDGSPREVRITILPAQEVKRERQVIRPGTARVRGRKTRASERLGFGSLKGIGARSDDLSNCRICARRRAA